jgi:glycosyltransferase involved in cell wall biosynthesis
VYAGRLRDALADDPDQRHVVAALFDAPAAGLRPDIVLTGRSTVLRRLGLDPRAVRALRRVISREPADLVVAHGGEPLKYAVAAGVPVPVVYYKIGLSSAELSRRSRLALYRFLVGRVALGVAVSRPIRDQLQHQLRMPPERLRIIPNSRDPEVYRPASPPPTSGRVLFIGELEVGKRPDLFLDVVERLRAMGMKFTAAVIGDGSQRPEIERRARRLDVELMGTRDDVPDLLREAAVLVLTSAGDTEGMPGVLIEAGLSMVPVVTTDAAGASDVVVDTMTGFVVDSDDTGDIADRIATLLRDPDLRHRLGSRAREHCVEHFSVAAGAARWRDLADEARGARRGGGG